jgi:hypothetical protein
MKLNKQTREGLEIYGEALVEYADGFDIDDLDDLFGEEPLDDIEMDDDELSEMNFLIGWFTCLSEVTGIDPVELLQGCLEATHEGSEAVH